MPGPNAHLGLNEEADKLLKAIRKNDVKTVRRIVAAHPRILRWQTGHGTLMHYVASEGGSVEMVKLFFSMGFDLEVSEDGISTPLWCAAGPKGPDDVVKFLIERGADVNAGAEKWATVLHCAVQACRPRIVRLLLEHGADPRFEDPEGETPLALATRCKFDAVVEVLREFNAPMVGKSVKNRPKKVVSIDLSKAAPQVAKLVRRAIARFVKKHRKKSVTALALHGSGVHGFVSVGFDTGEFTGDVPGMKYFEFELLEYPKWQKAYEYAEHIRLTTHNGRVRNLAGAGGTDDEAFQKPFFDLFVHVLKELQAAKVFERLTRAPNFQIGVEIMDGTHGKFWKVK